MERINELVEGNSLENIWNMDESGCFFKALPDKRLVEKGKQANHFLTKEYNFEATTTGCWHHHRRRLVKYVLVRIQEDASATQIVKGVDVLVAIRWLQEAWKEVTNLTIKNCFEKCGIKGDNELMEVEEDDDLEFEALVKEFTADISAAEYANFDGNVQCLSQ